MCQCQCQCHHRARFEIPEIQYIDKVVDVPVVIPDRPKTAEIHVVHSIDTEINISVNMRRQVPTERKSVEVARTQHSMMRSLRCHGR